MSEPEEDSRPTIEKALTTGILILSATIAFATQLDRLAFLIQVTVGIVIGAFTIAWIGWVFRPFARYVRLPNPRLVTKEGGFARQNIKELKSIIERFQKVYDIRRMDTIVYPLMSLRGRGGDFANIPNPNTTYVESFCYLILKGLDSMKQDKETLAWGVEFFNWVLRMFNDQLIVPTVTAIRTVAAQVSMPQDVKEDYNTNRLAYLAFLNDYENFIDRGNKELGGPRQVTIEMPGGPGFYEEYPLRQLHLERPKEL